jgi:hypothetical protein
MKKFIVEYWVGAILLLIASFVLYIIYVNETATRTEGCSYIDHLCVKSHIETSDRYYAKSWHTEETEVCDESEEIEVPCDCITYHWFWGDHKNY